MYVVYIWKWRFAHALGGLGDVAYSYSLGGGLFVENIV